MTGKLILCATPIGNLGDMTPRCVQTLREADLIAAEDTRNSRKLLTHFDIHTPMTSYHEFNKYDKARELVEKMQQGAVVALITDAGTPGTKYRIAAVAAKLWKEGAKLRCIRRNGKPRNDRDNGGKSIPECEYRRRQSRGYE